MRFERVSFRYRFSRNILQDIDFHAQPGQVVALLGMTGSGKSTVINLIARFYDPTAGRVLIDGHDLRELELRDLRRRIGIVLQDSVLFAASIRENIAFGRPQATDEEVFAAARDAQAHDFIMETVEGYDTRVGERGTTLSGGQKQRIAIARTILRNPSILVLDEATSALDSESERQVQTAIDNLSTQRTTLIIAHRLSTIRNADIILFFKDGKIAEQGTHGELIAMDGEYAHMVTLQMMDQDDTNGKGSVQTPASEKETS